jgi:hypothetical protein
MYRRLRIGDTPDKINICPICARRLPEKPEAKTGLIFVCNDATWRFNGVEWEVAIVDLDWTDQESSGRNP